MKESFGGVPEVHIDNIGDAHKELGVNLESVRSHIEKYKGVKLNPEALGETNAFIQLMTELQQDYPDSPEVRSVIAALNNLVWVSEKNTESTAGMGSGDDDVEMLNIQDPDSLRKEIEGMMHSEE